MGISNLMCTGRILMEGGCKHFITYGEIEKNDVIGNCDACLVIT